MTAVWRQALLASVALVLCAHAWCLGAQSRPVDYPALLALTRTGQADALQQALAGLAVDDVSLKGRSLLMMRAIVSREPRIVSLLLRWGISPNRILTQEVQREPVKMTALQFAIASRAPEFDTKCRKWLIPIGQRSNLPLQEVQLGVVGWFWDVECGQDFGLLGVDG